jgi:hypothetical protein
MKRWIFLLLLFGVVLPLPAVETEIKSGAVVVLPIKGAVSEA